MANAAYSVNDDLMVGAGALYFNRKKSDGTYAGLHHMGNADEFTITNDPTTITKNSTVDHERRQMASVTTGIKTTFSLTLSEYDATNLALGLYGTESVYAQSATTITDAEYTVESVPGIVQLVDANGHNYFNISAVTVKPETTVPASIGATTLETSLGSTGTMTSGGTYTGLANKTYYVKVATAPTASGDLAGMVISYSTSLIGTFTPLDAFTTGTSKTSTLADGVTVTAAVSTGQTFTVNEIYVIACTAATSAYVSGTDFVVPKHEARAGMIKIPASSHIAVGDKIKVSATVPAGSYPSISGGNAGDIEGKLVYIGDPNMGGYYNVQAWKVKMAPDGALSGLIGTDFGSYKLTGTVEDDAENHPDYPLYEVVQVGSAS